MANIRDKMSRAEWSVRTARVIGVVVLTVGVLGLIGWWAGIPPLRQVLPGLASMKPNTALGLALCGVGLCVGSGAAGGVVMWWRILAGSIAGLIGAVTIGQYVFGVKGGIDGILLGSVDREQTLRMTPAAATSLICAGSGLVLTSWPVRAGRAERWLESVLALMPVLIGGLALLGYLYGARSLYQTFAYSSMALHTAAMLVLTGVGLVMSRSQQGLAGMLLSDGLGGMVARRLTAFFVLLAPMMGWVRLMGQEAGWYDYRFGLAVMISSLMVVGVWMIWWTCSALERLDSHRAAAQSGLAASVERERSAAAQREAILEALPQGIVLLDTRGRVVAFNKRWGELCGRVPEPETVGLTFSAWCERMMGLNHNACVGASEGAKRVIDGSVDSYLEEFAAGAVSSGSKRERWIEVRVSPVLVGLSGRAAVVMVSDVSERRLLEDQLVQAQKLEAVGRLAGGIAHDFNNLLTAVMGHRALAQSALEMGQSASENLEAIEQAARSGAVLTAELLAFGRRQVIEPRVVDAEGLVSSVRRLMERGVGEGVRLSVVIQPGVWRLRVDPGRIEQVLLNLVINARDAMPGGGAIDIEARNAELGRAYTQHNPGVEPGRYVCIAVSDTGMGMSPAVKARLFEPFFTTKAMGKGSGLGLATSFGIVKQHGGHIAVYSEEGRGTTFRVYLPAASPAENPAPIRAGLERARGGRERVLLVDDHTGARTAVAGMLRSLGYTVSEAIDGGTAEAALLASPRGFDLLICDVVLPDETGPNLVSRLRALPGWEDLAVLFISGYTANAIVHHGVLDDGVHYLSKPFSVDELDAKVRSVLDR